MNILHVIPIARGIGRETLSYFSASDIPVGSVVKISVRNRTVSGLVVAAEPVSSAKAELKSSSFAMKKISGKPSQLFLPEFVRAAQKAGWHFSGTTGSILASLAPKSILENTSKISPPAEKTVAPGVYELMSLQSDEEERLAHYKSLIREQFARKKSVFFCLPTIQDTKRVFETLPKGIEEYTHVLNATVQKKKLVETWNKIVEEPHPVLIIATGTFMGIPRRDLGAIIIERESASSYKSQVRPYTDIRTFAEMLGKELKAKVILGDVLLRTETLWRTRNGEFAELSPLKFRSISTAESIVVDMKKYKTLESPEFRIIGEELENLIRMNKENNEHMLIFAARRGLSPMTVCGDCGTTVLCSRCSAPVVLHRTKSKEGEAIHFFLCHRCGEQRSAEERCRVCNSWKLTTLGIGVELIEQTLTEMFPDIKFFRIDKDAVKTHKQATDTAARFSNAPGSVLIGTEMALLYLEEPVENAGVAAIDSLFSIPDFRINEKIMNILLRTRSYTKKKFVVQTRSRDQHIFDFAIKGNLMDFYREEIDGRKALEYPPFSTLIKITARGQRAAVQKDIEYIEKIFAEYQPLVFPAFIETVKRETIIHAILKIPRSEGIPEKLKEQLLSLPPHIAVNVDPESLL